ncbi:MAG: RNA-binding S4 domain-containing protein [Planctomycetaceae bacterium]|nr:RNA-binding S4 domain-containing protein [Planctomycetaceae bacterium]
MPSTNEERPLRLDQFLKLEGLADTGGMAKVAIQSGDVELNGVVETRRGKKLQVGDRVRFAGEERVVGPQWFE